MAIDLKRLHHQIVRLVDLGLLVVVGERAREGRPIKLYRTVARSFYISGEVSPKLMGDELSRELRESLHREASRGYGIVFTAAPGGSPRGRVIAAKQPAATEFWRVLRLSKAEASALRGEMTALLNRYQREAGHKGGEICLVHAAVAKRADQTGSVDNVLVETGRDLRRRR